MKCLSTSNISFLRKLVLKDQSRNPDNFYSMRASIETYRSSFIPSSVRLYNGVKHAQLRMKCGKLNFHLFSLHVVDSPACLCGHNREDSNHYLLRCPLYHQARNMLLNEIRELTMTDISCELLLMYQQISVLK